MHITAYSSYWERRFGVKMNHCSFTVRTILSFINYRGVPTKLENHLMEGAEQNRTHNPTVPEKE